MLRPVRTSIALALLALGARGAAQTPPPPDPPSEADLRALALEPSEREERLALALHVAMAGDCEAALARLGDPAADPADELGRRTALERERIQAWIGLRDAVLAEFAGDGKTLALEIGGKKVSTAFTREGDELVLARGPEKRISVRALAPEMLLPSIPKERFTGAEEWLKIYPYCVTGNAKWKRLTTSHSSSDALKQDAEETYPDLWSLGEVALALEELAARPAPTSATEARACVAAIGALLAQRERACVARRAETLASLAERGLHQAAAALSLADLVHGRIETPKEGITRLVYDFSDPLQAEDWFRDDAYLAEVRRQLDPVRAGDESSAFAPGPKGFQGNGAVTWRHRIEFEAPVRVRYQVRWEPTETSNGQVFAFAMGILGDAGERHVRCAELGFLYVDERDGRYLARRPKGDAVVQLGQTYEIELVHDGQHARVLVDGVERADGDAKARKEGSVFLWCHSDLLISVPRIEVEGRVTADTLARLRAAWVREARAALVGTDGR